MKIEFLKGNVFRSHDLFYFIYKVDLSKFSFKAIVGCFAKEDGEEMYFDTNLYDWFSLKKLEDSLLVGEIETDLETEDINYKLKNIAENYLSIKNYVYYDKIEKTILYVVSDKGNLVTCEVFALIDGKYECASSHDFVISELNDYECVGYVNEEYAVLDNIVSFVENYLLGEYL